MTKLKFEKNVKDIQSILVLSDQCLVKKADSLLLFDSEGKLQRSVSDSTYTTKILVDRDRRYVYLVSSLFQKELNLYSFSDFSLAFSLKEYKGKTYFFKDAVYTPDGKYLYVLADDENYDAYSESVLFKLELSTLSYSVFFLGEGKHFDSLCFFNTRLVLTLLDKRGKIYFFSQDKIIRKIKVPFFDRLFFIDFGQVMILSSLAGFNLCSANGKVIRKCDFLLPKPLKEEQRVKKEFDTENEILSLKGLPKISMSDNLSECYKDMIFSTEAGALFYLSYHINEKSYTLYHYSIRSFTLKHVYRIKSEVYGMVLDYPYLYVRTKDGVMVYHILQD